MRIVAAIHDPPVWSIPVEAVARLAAALPGDDVVDARETDERRRLIPTADILFATKLKAEEFAPALRWIHSSAVGVAPLLIPEVLRSDVIVTNWRGVHSETIAEHAIALALAMRRSLHTARTRQAEHRWAQAEISENDVDTLRRTTMLVVGLGTIGSRIASFAAGLGMHVIGVRRHVSLPRPTGVAEVLAPDQLRDGLAAADVVVLAVPRTEETRALIGRAELAVMKRTAILVNVARGRLIDDAALIDALKNQRLGGAALDAFQQEPLPPDHPFWEMPNV